MEKLRPYRDGTFRWRVWFEGESRIVYARSANNARIVAEHAQRLTKAPEKSRRAYSVVLLDPETNEAATPEQDPFREGVAGVDGG